MDKVGHHGVLEPLTDHHDHQHSHHPHHDHHHNHQDNDDDDHVTPAGVKLDHHGVLERLADHHVHVQQRELPYSSVKLEGKEAFLEEGIFYKIYWRKGF